MALGHKICNLIEGTDDEVDELHFADGAQSAVAHSTSGADNSALADRSINDALPAEPLQESLTRLESPAVYPDVFAHQNNRRVAFHFLKHCLLDSFQESNLRSGWRAAIPSGAVCFGHGYLRAFLEALTCAGFTVFFGATFAGAFTADLRATARFASAGCVSPK